MTARRAPLRSPARPAQDEVPRAAEVAPWYAVSDDGQASLRIVSGLRIGETGNGALVLNDPSPANAWVRFTLAEDGRPRIEVIKAGCVLRDSDGPAATAHQVVGGAKIIFPNNILHITRDVGARHPHGPLLEIVRGEALPSAPAPQPAAPPDKNFHRPVRAPARDAAPSIRPRRSKGRRTAMASVLGVLLAAGAAIILYQDVGLGDGWWRDGWLREPGAAAESIDEPVIPGSLAIPSPAVSSAADVTPAGSAPPDEADSVAAGPAMTDTALASAADPGVANVFETSADPVPAGAVEIADADPVMADAAAALTTDPATAAGLDDPPRAAAPENEDSAALDDPRLDRARQLIDAGQATYPAGRQAMGLIAAVLLEHPGHPEALRVMEQATAWLIQAAVSAHDQGQAFEARNILEEVFAYDPENIRARELWRAWVGTRR